MHELSDTDERDVTAGDVIDWAASCRLALVVSLIAGFAALTLASVVAETTIVVSVIVLGTAVSWFQLERRSVITSGR